MNIEYSMNSDFVWSLEEVRLAMGLIVLKENNASTHGIHLSGVVYYLKLNIKII